MWKYMNGSGGGSGGDGGGRSGGKGDDNGVSSGIIWGDGGHVGASEICWRCKKILGENENTRDFS